MRPRVMVSALVFALATGAIAYGVLTDARDTRLQALLEQIESAEETIPCAGTLLMIGTETAVFRFRSQAGHKRMEFVEVRRRGKETRRPRGPRVPSFGSFPAFLRPRDGAWKRRIKDYELAVRNYDVALAARETVAGRQADVIDVRSRRPDRASYRIHADSANRYPLRFQVLAAGERVFETAVEEIEFYSALPEPPSPESRRPGWLTVTREQVPASRMGEKIAFPFWMPLRPPAGFELRGSEVLRVRFRVPEGLRPGFGSLRTALPPGEATVAHFTYTDGMAVLSVVEWSSKSELWSGVRRFIPGYKTAKPGEKVVAQKFSDRRGAAYFMEIGETVVFVTGNVSPESLETMIRTLERR